MALFIKSDGTEWAASFRGAETKRQLKLYVTHLLLHKEFLITKKNDEIRTFICFVLDVCYLHRH
jgi:hypothetical protein